MTVGPDVWVAVSISNGAAIGLAGATLLLAIFTGIMAFLTWRGLEKTQQLADAATKEADSVAKQSGAVSEQARQAARQADLSNALLAEVRTDRELAWRPWLVLKERDVVDFVDGGMGATVERVAEKRNSRSLVPSLNVTVHNIGPGPALNCRYVGYFSIWDEDLSRASGAPNSGQFFGGRAYYRSAAFSLAGGEERVIEVPQSIPGGQVTSAIHALQWSGNSAKLDVLLCMDEFRRKFRFHNESAIPDIWPPEIDDPEATEPDWAHDASWM